jgi:hypothetical protein
MKWKFIIIIIIIIIIISSSSSSSSSIDHLCGLWSGFLATDPEVLLRSSWSGMESTQHREYNWGATSKK